MCRLNTSLAGPCLVCWLLGVCRQCLLDDSLFGGCSGWPPGENPCRPAPYHNHHDSSVSVMAVRARPRMLESHEVGRGATSKDGRGQRKVVSSQRAGISISFLLLLSKSFNVKRSLNETARGTLRSSSRNRDINSRRCDHIGPLLAIVHHVSG